ncbi:MAG: hypothetical protein WC346_02925 [Methanogenium sp.]|jgi:hypothetical protein
MSNNEAIEVNTSLEVFLPIIPNYLRIGVPDNNDRAFPIESFSEADLQKIGEAWTAALIQKARKRKQIK